MGLQLKIGVPNFTFDAWLYPYKCRRVSMPEHGIPGRLFLYHWNPPVRWHVASRLMKCQQALGMVSCHIRLEPHVTISYHVHLGSAVLPSPCYYCMPNSPVSAITFIPMLLLGGLSCLADCSSADDKVPQPARITHARLTNELDPGPAAVTVRCRSTARGRYSMPAGIFMLCLACAAPL